MHARPAMSGRWAVVRLRPCTQAAGFSLCGPAARACPQWERPRLAHAQQGCQASKQQALQAHGQGHRQEAAGFSAGFAAGFADEVLRPRVGLSGAGAADLDRAASSGYSVYSGRVEVLRPRDGLGGGLGSGLGLWFYLLSINLIFLFIF